MKNPLTGNRQKVDFAPYGKWGPSYHFWAVVDNHIVMVDGYVTTQTQLVPDSEIIIVYPPWWRSLGRVVVMKQVWAFQRRFMRTSEEE